MPTLLPALFQEPQNYPMSLSHDSEILSSHLRKFSFLCEKKPYHDPCTVQAKEATLYSRLGGYDAIAAVADDLLRRLTTDAQLGRFWQHRGEDGLRREKQLLIDFLCASAGGPLY